MDYVKEFEKELIASALEHWYCEDLESEKSLLLRTSIRLKKLYANMTTKEYKQVFLRTNDDWGIFDYFQFLLYGKISLDGIEYLKRRLL